MKKVMCLFVSIVLLTSLAFAALGNSPEQNHGNPTVTSDSEGSINDDEEKISNGSSLKYRLRNTIENRLDSEGKVEDIKEALQERQLLRLEKIGMNVTRENGELIVDQNKQKIKTRMNISIEGNGTVLRTTLSNGRNAEIKLMPSTASGIALERLRLKVCNEERNCTIQLKEVASNEGGNLTRAVYEARLRKEFKILGLFKARNEVMAQVDAESGEIIETHKPWWSFLATEETDN